MEMQEHAPIADTLGSDGAGVARVKFAGATLTRGAAGECGNGSKIEFEQRLQTVRRGARAN